MQYSLATETWDEDEKSAAKAVIDSGMCTMGKITTEFETEFAEKVGSKYAVFSNSGSSANLLAVAACVLRKNGFSAGDEVIVPALSWSTTYFPLQQYGLKLVFVDIDENMNIDPEQIKKAISSKTVGIMAVNILGCPCQFDEIKQICSDNNLTLIEDNCESMGSTYKGKICGTLGNVGTFSTFFSHHICTVEGGITVTDDEEMYHIMLSVRSHGWTRHLPDDNKIENKSGDSFFDSFRFVLPGYNLRNNDIFSAIGLEQLKKIDSFVEQRTKNMNYLSKIFELKYNDNKISLKQNILGTNIQSSSFGFAFICENVDRNTVVQYLMNNNIECRPIVAGNFTKNPVIKYFDYKIIGSLVNTNNVDVNGFFVGNNSDDLSKEIDYLVDIMGKM